MILQSLEEMIKSNPPESGRITYEWIYKYIIFLDLELTMDMLLPMNESLVRGLKITVEEGVESIESDSGAWLAYKDDNGNWQPAEFGPNLFGWWLFEFERLEVDENKFYEIFNKL